MNIVSPIIRKGVGGWGGTGNTQNFGSVPCIATKTSFPTKRNKWGARTLGSCCDLDVIVNTSPVEVSNTLSNLVSWDQFQLVWPEDMDTVLVEGH